MFTIKRIAAAAAAVVVALTLSACRADENTPKQPIPEQPTSTTQSQPTPEATEPDVQAEMAWISDVRPLLKELGWELAQTSMGCSLTNESIGRTDWLRVCVPKIAFNGEEGLQPMLFDGDGDSMQMRFTDFSGTPLDPINPQASDGIVPPAFVEE